MFVNGAHAKISGWGHRDDPAACYIEDITIGDAPTRNRNDQFTTQAVDTSNRLKRRPTGEPNITGDWAQEQYVIAVPPSGGGNLVPKSLIAAVESGQLAMRDVPPSGWGARPVTYTARGKAEASSSTGCSTAPSTASRKKRTASSSTTASTASSASFT
jgi:hypothetical protein